MDLPVTAESLIAKGEQVVATRLREPLAAEEDVEEAHRPPGP